MGIKCIRPFSELPCKTEILEFAKEVRNYIYPGYFEEVKTTFEDYQAEKILVIKRLFESNVSKETAKFECFKNELPTIIEKLKTDIEFAYDSDPACYSIDEIILAYPGIFAITYHRIAHVLYTLSIPIIPRIISEYAHEKTGIDIHPGANIGSYFFIDHGTGIVIGETTTIGHHVKIYHGVTLGAISLRNVEGLRSTKRHPTVEDNVTIYSSTSILGGETIIGENSTIGCNQFITKSVEKNSKIY